jgi:hypothetical protein
MTTIRRIGVVVFSGVLFASGIWLLQGQTPEEQTVQEEPKSEPASAATSPQTLPNRGSAMSLPRQSEVLRDLGKNQVLFKPQSETSLPAKPQLSAEAKPPLPDSIPNRDLPASKPADEPAKDVSEPAPEVLQDRPGRLEDVGINYKLVRMSDGKALVELSTDNFTSEKTIQKDGRSELRLTSSTGDSILLKFDQTGYTVEKDGQVVTLPFNADPDTRRAQAEAARVMLGGDAIAQFREKLAELEGTDITTDADRFAVSSSAMLDSAIMSEIAGDPTALTRVKDRLLEAAKARVNAQMKPQLVKASFTQRQRSDDEMRDCVLEYERYLMDADNSLRSCLDSANREIHPHARSGARVFCHAEFLARSQSGIWQFITCSAIPWK